MSNNTLVYLSLFIVLFITTVSSKFITFSWILTLYLFFSAPRGYCSCVFDVYIQLLTDTVNAVTCRKQTRLWRSSTWRCRSWKRCDWSWPSSSVKTPRRSDWTTASRRSTSSSTSSTKPRRSVHGRPKKADTRFIFAITSANEHRF